MADKRRAKTGTALLSKNGYIRLSSDLIPSDARKRKLKFTVKPLVEEKALVLLMVNGRSNSLSLRAAMWPNDAARSPLVAIRSALKFLGVALPKKSKEYAVVKEGGNLKITF